MENISSDVKERLLDEIDNIGIRNMYGNRMVYYDYQERQWGFLDQDLNIVIPPRYNRVQDFNDGLAAVLDNSGNWGYIEPEGNTVIAHNFSKQPTPFRDGYAKVEKRNGLFAYINKTGEIVYDDMHDAGVFIGGYAYFTKKPDENSTLKTHRIDTDLNVVLADNVNNRAREVTNYTSDGTRYTRDAIVDLDGNVLLAGCSTVFTNGLAVMDYTAFVDNQAIPMKGLMRRNGEVAVLFVEKEF
ncbi:MAG: WG repeat-containing protein [Rikenellaceae bacterium]|nr:WG repeat-containing protein [Rikenellaceae bacterium]